MSSAASIRYRVAIASRFLAAALGGYAAASAIAFGLARALPMIRSEAMTAATLIAVPAMPAATVWAFAVRSAWRAWGGIVAVAAAAFALGWLCGQPA